jgi:hypothetical protein
MSASFIKCSSQNVFDAVNLGRHIPRCQAGDLADGRRVHALQIRENDLAIHRLQLLYQREQAAERLLVVGVRHRLVCQMVELFQADQHVRVHATLPDRVGCGGVVSNTIHPGAHRATLVPTGKAAPEGKVYFLQKVATIIRVGLVGAGQAFQRGAVSGGSFAVSVVLRSFHSQVVTCGEDFLQGIQKELAFGHDLGRAGEVDVAVEAQIDRARRRQHTYRTAHQTAGHRHRGGARGPRTAAHGLPCPALPEAHVDRVLVH